MLVENSNQNPKLHPKSGQVIHLPQTTIAIVTLFQYSIPNQFYLIT